MRRDTKNITFGVLALLVSVVAVGLVYAGFTQTLNINGTGNVTASKWSIHFENLSNPTLMGTASLTTPAEIKTGKTQIGDYEVVFATPGDSLTYTFDIVNEGDFDGYISTLTKTSPSCTGGGDISNTNVCKNLTYTLKYTQGGKNVSENDKLLVGQTKNVTLTLTLNANMPASELPTSEVTVGGLGITILYSQDSAFGGNPHVPAVTYVRRQNEGQITPEDEVAIGDEHFYVVSSDATNTVLLAKYDLKSDGADSYEQDTSGTSTNIVKVNFLDSNNTAYWDNRNCTYNGGWTCSGTGGLKSEYANASNAAGATSYTSPYPYVYDENAVNIYPVVESYANKIATEKGIELSGRLMTYEEGNSLSRTVRNDMNGNHYWLGSAYNNILVWNVGANGLVGLINTYNTRGVRPVIIVSTSEIED